MSDNTREPENSANEDVGVPTARKEGDVYARAGRVAPQQIPASAPQAQAESGEAKPTPFSEQEPTVTFSPQEDFDDHVDVPVAPSSGVKSSTVPPHPSDAPTTVFEPQSAEPTRIPTRDQDSRGGDNARVDNPSGEPTVMFDSPGRAQQSPFSLREPGEQPQDVPDQPVGYRSTVEHTTALPPYQPNQAEEPYLGAAGQQETSVPVAVSDPTATPAASVEAAAVDARRGTIDFGIFIIRFFFGALLVLASVKTFFQLGGNTGLAGLEAEYANYLQPGILAVAIPAMLLTAGVFLLLGLVTPLAAALATVGTTFEALHVMDTDGEAFDPLRLGDNVWLAILLVVLAVGLQFTGPGRISLDFGRSWARRPLISSWVFVVLSVAGAGALWWFGAGVNPFN